MADFDQAIGTVLKHEGGPRFSDHPADPGGPTRWGISLRFALAELGGEADIDHDGDVDSEDIRMLPRDLAIEAYRRCWWERYGYERIVDQQVATKLLDMSVNVGGKQAHLILQRAVNACGYRLVEDGVLGPATLEAANACEARELLLELAFQQSEFYRSLVTRKPRLEVFRKGWLARAAWPFSKGAYTAQPTPPASSGKGEAA